MKQIGRIIVTIIIVMVIISASLLLSHRFLYKNKATKTTHTLTVLTYNTHRMGMYEKPQRNEVIKYLDGVDADVLCLQEVEVYKVNKYLTLSDLKQAFSRYPYTYFDFKVYNKRLQFGNVVFSRYPLVNKHTIRYSSRSNISSCCDIVVRGDTIRLITNHLESYRFTEDEVNGFVNHPSMSVQPIKERFLPATRMRWHQARLINQAVKESPYPVIAVGDMNAIPLSPTYYLLRRNMQDAFLSTSNFRLGDTFKKGKWGIRIDYILHSPTLVATDFSVGQTTASDHLPIQATIAW